jgi:hypothetical protein
MCLFSNFSMRRQQDGFGVKKTDDDNAEGEVEFESEVLDSSLVPFVRVRGEDTGRGNQ